MSTFTEALITRRLSDGKKWSVETEFNFYEKDNLTGTFANIYEGFVTDLSSIPRLLHALIPKTGKHDQAAVLHDMGYKYNVVFEDHEGEVTGYDIKDRKYWDDLFLDAMLVSGVRKSRAYTIYAGVRTFGKFAWSKHRKKASIHPLILKTWHPEIT